MIVEIDYTNWRGERRKRHIRPIEIKFEATKWHPQPQWILYAIDVNDTLSDNVKGFALKDVHSWKPTWRVGNTGETNGNA